MKTNKRELKEWLDRGIIAYDFKRFELRIKGDYMKLTAFWQGETDEEYTSVYHAIIPLEDITQALKDMMSVVYQNYKWIEIFDKSTDTEVLIK